MEEFFDITYTIQYIVFYNPVEKFAIATTKHVKIESDVEQKTSNITVLGNYQSIQPGDTFTSKGKWIYNKNHGWQVETSMSRTVVPANTRGIKRFLKRFVPGIGKVTSDIIVNAYGLETLDKIRSGIESLTCLPKIGPKKAQSIYDAVRGHDELEKLALFLFQHGVTSYTDVIDIYEKNISCLMIQSDPYCICDILSPSSFVLADKIACSLGENPESVSRIAHGVLYYLSTRTFRSGDLYVTYMDLQTDFFTFLQEYGAYSNRITNSNLLVAIKWLIDNEKIITEKVDGKSLIYSSFFHYTEQFVASSLISMNSEDALDNSKSVDTFLHQYQTQNTLTLDDKQKDAVRAAATHRVSLLTGGPGTGKSHTVNVMIQYFQNLKKDINIYLVAPTGRAAKRMTEVSGMEATTIHRFLSIRPNSLSHPIDSIEEVDADVVIVDEMSMVDIVLFAQLLKALKNSHATIVLIGDPDQLPSVGPGLVLRDLINSNCLPVTKLSTLFRQSALSQIHTNAHKVIHGITTSDKNGLTFEIAKQDCFFFSRDNEDAIRNTLIQSIQSLLAKQTFLLEDIIVLSPVRKGLLGVVALNRVLQDIFNPADITKAQIEIGSQLFRQGDRVMQITNNYDLCVFNGEIGEVASIDMQEETITIAFPSISLCEAYVTYSFLEARELELAYAMTIHKSQGGEFPCVIMPVFHTAPNWSRNILYTAMTRAKKMLVMIGTTRTLDNAINTVSNVKRNTRLSCRLQSLMLPPCN